MLMRAVLQSAAQPRGVLEVYSQPAGARCSSMAPSSASPYKRPALVGSHKIVLQHVGYRSEQFRPGGRDHRQRTERTLVAGTDPIKVVVVEKENPGLQEVVVLGRHRWRGGGGGGDYRWHRGRNQRRRVRTASRRSRVTHLCLCSDAAVLASHVRNTSVR